ncbi:MAG: hypothetical protein GYA17_11425 [Chloroflexi bacterium]|jgi:lysophospholipase L1-like esterase|nr:GDSL-type esterase/lipase family protein [Anaerolineaceae bacterium]NMB88963.1 hypothetical protein [Chloroflexota bacterium]
MQIIFLGDSLTKGIPGVSYLRILERRLPQHTLINWGLGGDTVISLYRRMLKHDLQGPFDIAVLWIGTNDVYARLEPIHPWVRKLRWQPWSKNEAEFRQYYRQVLDYICPRARQVIAVTPLAVGEDREGHWNRQLAHLAEVECQVLGDYPEVSLVDLQAETAAALFPAEPAPYVATATFSVLWDALALVTNEQVDRVSRRRGLHFTLDGVHLNSLGANQVAGALEPALREAIRRLDGAAPAEENN